MMKSESPHEIPAMSPQQKKLGHTSNPLRTYREYMVGDSSLWSWILLEFYQLFLAPVPGILGLALRSKFLPLILGSCGKSVAVGRSVTIRQPNRIHLGNKVIIDDYVVLDARDSSKTQPAKITIDDNVLIGRNSLVLSKGANIQIGRASNISSFCRVASTSVVKIGESVLVAAYAYIGPGNHLNDSPETPIMEQGMEEGRGVNIGNNVWIGTRATILDGSTIGNNSVVAGHAFVNTDIPENAVFGGIPAKLLRYRT